MTDPSVAARLSTPDLSKLTHSLEWLATRGHLSGSLARGDWHADSDIDVRLAERHVKTLKRMLQAQGVKWDSPFLGSITWWPEGHQVEVSYLFPRYKPHNRTLLIVEAGVRMTT